MTFLDCRFLTLLELNILALIYFWFKKKTFFRKTYNLFEYQVWVKSEQYWWRYDFLKKRLVFGRAQQPKQLKKKVIHWWRFFLGRRHTRLRRDLFRTHTFTAKIKISEKMAVIGFLRVRISRDIRNLNMQPRTNFQIYI